MNVRKELENKNCIFSAHFVGTSGKHLAGYCNIDPALPHAAFINDLTMLMVEPFKDDGIETIISPAIGAIPFASLGALHLEKMTGKKVFGVWADKTKVNDEKDFIFERSGFEEKVKGKKVIILEDMINQMVSINKVVSLVNRVGGEIAGVASVAGNKGVSAEAIGVPKYVRLCAVEYDAWTPEDCAKVGLCSKKRPIVEDIGHGDSFKEEHPDYAGGYIKLLS